MEKKIVYCDRCGKECEEIRRCEYRIYPSRDDYLDLCQKCSDDLVSWVRNVKAESEDKIDTSDLPIKMTAIAYSTHDCESWYECPSCRTQYGSWGFYHNNQKGGDIFTCSCGQKLYVPK